MILEIGQDPRLLFAEIAAGADKKEQGIIPGPPDGGGYLRLLHPHPCGHAGSDRGIDLAHIEKLAIFLGHVHGGVGIGQGLAPGDILHGQVLEDVMLGGLLDGLLLDDVQQFLKVIRVHVPQLLHRVIIQ